MKKLAGFLFIILIAVGCESKDSDEPKVAEQKDKYAFDSSDIKTEPLSNPNENFQLIYNFEKNKNYRYRFTSISDINRNMSGPTPWGTDTTINDFIHQDVVYLLDLKLDEADKEIMELTCNISSVKAKLQSPQQTVNYESGTMKDSLEKLNFADYESLINNPFSFRISRSGEIEEIFRVDKIVSNYLQITGLKDSVTNEQKNIIRNDLSERILKGLLTQVFRKVPETNLAKDSSWSISQPLQKSLGFEVQASIVYKVNNLEKLKDDKIAVIDASIKSDIKGKNKFSEQGVSYDVKTPVILANGKIYFDISNGLIIKSKTSTTTENSVTAEGNTPMGKQSQSNKAKVVNTNILELL